MLFCMKSPPAKAPAHDSGAAMVRVDVLQGFSALVAQLGGDASALLAKAQIDPIGLNDRHTLIPHRSFVRLLERACLDLKCPDFGLRLAAAQGGVKVLGPLGYAMRNSPTVREAFKYCVEHIRVYSAAVRMAFEKSRVPGSVFLRVEFLLPRTLKHPQALERALLLTRNSALDISSGKVQAREVWITHEPLSPVSAYREYFAGAQVRFGQRMSGLLFDESELDLPNPQADPQVYEVVTDFIENHCTTTDSVVTRRIRALVEHTLLEGNCTHNGVAAMMGMHPRALQRRLQAEGESFEAIKDGVRRKIALRYLKESSMPLIRVARMLGYAEASALSRSCYRWFSASPGQVRGTSR